jgi:transcriptional regulator with XRE-family HTH domain
MQNYGAAMTPESLVQRLKYVVDVLGLSQQELAIATGVHQSQISRMLSGSAKRVSKNLVKVSECLENLHGGYANNSEIPQVLKDAIQFSWDGTPGHADALARVIISLKDLSCMNSRSIEDSPHD